MSQSENGAGNGEYLSIGEVLALLQQEFSDIKISKIRFLEAQGLINPERTSAGFRRFYPHDVEQLRWILAQQRDNFLPLKVIKARLDDGEAPIAVTQPHLWEHDEAPPPAVAPAKPHDSASPTPAVSAQANGAGPPSGSPRRDAAQWLASLQEQPLRQSKRSFSTSVAPSDLAQVEGLAFSEVEVCEQTGATGELLAECIQFGLISPQRVGTELTFPSAAIAVIEAVLRFAEMGIEVRHLRIFKNAIEREMGLFEQLIDPLIRQRNPESRQRAVEVAVRLCEASCLLHDAMLSHTSAEFRGVG